MIRKRQNVLWRVFDVCAFTTVVLAGLPLPMSLACRAVSRRPMEAPARMRFVWSAPRKPAFASIAAEIGNCG